MFVGKAVVLGEETGKCTTGAAGVGVQTRGEGYAEITSGRANFQQGFATNCEDSWYKGKTEAERGFWSGA
jgi:hypothetical protein